MVSKINSSKIQAEIAARIGTDIKRAEVALISRKTRALKRFDLTVPQYAALMTLYHSPGSSSAQVARACLVSAQTMNTVVKNLESKGLVVRAPSSVHHKVLVTELTPSGRALVLKADKVARSIEGELAGEFTTDERATLHELLSRAIETLNESQHGARGLTRD
jgi:DNA-binding MarR family transcriptional regulator